jgi:adenine-specific DNA-methyltransferase
MRELEVLFDRAAPATALDAFTGTTRVAQALKQRGTMVTTVDTATYADVFSKCYIQTDARTINVSDLDDAIRAMNALSGTAGYFTETFCRNARFFQPHNGERVDTIRTAIERDYAGTPLHSILLTSLIEAADKVDSTTGVQMAYVKQWAGRSFKRMTLVRPTLLPGVGRSICGDACEVVRTLPEVDLAYLDPPYNQHRYFTNYHVWETLVQWDAPEAYGVAQKRIDARDPSTKSVFNSRRTMPQALSQLIQDVSARVVILSYNDESWLDLRELVGLMECRGMVKALAFDSTRYVGAKIGIHNRQGKMVGAVNRLRNKEYVLVAGAREHVDGLCCGFDEVSLERLAPVS